jgi:hypothetical protein
MLSQILDWAVVAIPSIVGVIQWIIPIQNPTPKHRRIVLVACVAFSGLLFWQQHEARKAHEAEITRLPGDVANAVIKILPGQLIEKQRIPSTAETATPSPAADISGSTWALTDEQIKVLAMRMGFYADPSVDRSDLITCVLGDPASTQFAARLVTAFRAAHWNLPGSGFAQAVFSGPVKGIIVKVHSAEVHPGALLEFVRTMREFGIEPTGQIDDKISADDFQIVVGSKP